MKLNFLICFALKLVTFNSHFIFSALIKKKKMKMRNLKSPRNAIIKNITFRKIKKKFHGENQIICDFSVKTMTRS